MLDLDHAQEIAHALGRNKVRTALTAFGVFWGIFMLVIMLGSGNGLKNGIDRDFATGATNSFFLWTQRTSKPWAGLGPGRRIQLTTADTEAIRNQIAEAEIVAPRNQLQGFGGGNPVSRGTRSGAFNVYGDLPELKVIQGLDMTGGRFLNPLDLAERRKVAVIGVGVQRLLFARGEKAIGESIRVNGVDFQVIGTFKSLASDNRAEREVQSVFIPFTTFQQAFNMGDRVGWFAITARRGIPASVVEAKTLALLKQRHKVAPDDERAFGHWNMEEEYSRIQGLFAGIRALVWVVGIGTLAAGVIGVSNIMLVIVKERTRELGVRKAVGATPLRISAEIVGETVVLTALAGWAGLLAGMLLLDAARPLIARSGAKMFLDPDVTVDTALAALAILIVAGVLAGLIPAQRAVRINTVEALRAS